ncbi:1,4-dihydroxy-2-naphthoate octaprenyltransferase [Maribacter sp. 2210JD10-5]|uniref:1,4-dihydroxy-2-naphthoate octaprenyltransferase n=1 Tax=Maribacter sp. 2210JD10-5 TaxID=3386272 RepID=UPI0039BC8A62
MSKIGAWINAARLRTLPLSISGILVGTGLALYYGDFSWPIFVLAICTTVGFQITSNFANDYGDGVKGTDNDDRVGPKRALQSGLLTRKSLKKGIIVSIVINVLLVLLLLYFSFSKENLALIIFFLVLGALSIWAAIRYTVGDSAYGYSGLGDLFVFIFFGLVGVLGSMFLYIKTIPVLSFLPALAIGLLSVGVLNLNNLRDHISDKKAGKNTVVVKLGFAKAKKYHLYLLGISFFGLLSFVVFTHDSVHQFMCLIAYVPIIVHAIKVKKTESPARLDPELKKLALSTFLLAILFCLAYHNFL